MNFNRKTALRLEIAALPFVLASVAMPSSAWAQAAAPAPAKATANSEECVDANNNGVCDADETGSIVVTGSRIARDPNLTSSVPLTAIKSAELTDQGKISLGDALNDLPSIRSTFGSGNSTRFIGTAGLNILDLRGLGTARTLVLVNGRRHITARPGQYAVDTNTIPVDLLERVDIVTGGNSAIYGSDAVAGVVNFILKRNYNGISLKGQGGVSSRGDRGNYFLAGTFGRNFDDGRGNIAVAVEYAKQNPLYFVDRDYLTGAYSGRCVFQRTDLLGVAGGEVGYSSSDGIPDTSFLCGIRSQAFSDGGTIGALDPSSSSTRRFLRFDNDGNAYADSPTLSYAPLGSGNQIGGNGSTFNNSGQLFAGVERYAVNLLAHYDVSEAFHPYLEAKYVRINALQESGPSFFQGSLKSFFGTNSAQVAAISELRCNNPFLKSGSLQTLQNFGLCTNAATGTFTMARNNIDFGPRGERHKRETWRVVVGAEGKFNEDWHYDLSLNYGKLKTNVHSTNNLLLFDVNGNLDGFLLASNAVLAPAGYSGSNFVLNSVGQKVICGVNATTNTRPDCYPINVFGLGAPDPAALKFSHSDGIRNEAASELDIQASISGDLSQLFSLPGGPVAFALGGEYREETASSAWDPLVASGATFLNRLLPFSPPKLKVTEAFAEISIPLLKDTPFANELTIHGAGRVSHYNSSAGTVYAWNVDGIYAPIPDIKFRAAYATSVRAPTQSDLFGAQNQNFNQINDPCNSTNINVGPNRAANCAAAGVPTTYNAAISAACASTVFAGPVGTPFTNCPANSFTTPFVGGGNPNLASETGRSLTIGALVQPRFLPGFSFSADWYRITVKNLIAALGAQQIINLCYDNASGLNNPYCASVRRDPATGFFGNPAVFAGGINFAAQKTEGVDFDLQYRHSFDNGVKLSLRGIATWVRRLDNFTDPVLTFLPNRQLGELGDPAFAANLNATVDVGAFSLSYTVRYLGKQAISTYEAQHKYFGLCPTSGNIPGTTNPIAGIAGADGRACTPGTLALLDPFDADLTAEIDYPAIFYHSMRFNTKIADGKFNFYVGVDNLFDTKPPLGLLGTAGGDPFDTTGRFFYAGFKAVF